MDILVKSGRFSKWEDLAFGFHFGAVPPFLLIFHVFIVTVVGGVVVTLTLTLGGGIHKQLFP